MSTDGTSGPGPGATGLDRVDFGGTDAVGSDRVRSAALHQLPWYVVVYEGPEHHVVALNAAELQVFGGFNPTGMRLVDFLGGSQEQGIVEIFDRAYAGEQGLFHWVRMGVVTPNGHQQEIVVDFEVTPFRDRHGEVVGIIGAGRDVTAVVEREAVDAAAAAELGRRYRRATDVIGEVQHALLPTRLPVLPSVQLAASYVLGGAEQAAGGDWFDVLPRPDGSVAAVVGDVVGHGVAASAVMAQLRAVALERLDAGADPAQVVTALDRFTRVVPAARSATVLVLVLDPGTGALTHCSAGHPPPLVLDVEGGSRYLDPGGTPPLGRTGAVLPGRSVQHGTLGPGELVLLYTDGIVERPGVPATTGTVELARTAAAAAADELMPVFTLPTAAERVAVQTLERLTRVTGAGDDITLLALHPVSAPADLHERATVSRARTPALRARLRAWLGARQVATEAVDQLDEIVSELVENVVEHAYPDGTGPVELHAHLDELGTLTLTLTDQGRWNPPPQPAPGRGLGLAVVQELADHLDVRPSPHGTGVTVTFTPWTTPHGAAAQAPRPVPEMFDVYTEDRDDVSITTVRGPVDVADVPDLDVELALRTVPGAVPLTVDLGQVSVLSSAAVHALRRRLEQAAAAGVKVRLVAGPGTVAHHVLALVGITTGPAPA